MVDSAQPLKTKYASLGNYSLIKTLGSGYNSKVKLGFDATSSKYYAVKIVKHSHPSLNMKILKKEIEMLTTLSHPNIVNLIEFHESIDYLKKNNKSYKAVAIVMELVPGGELFEYVADSGRFSEETARKYFQTLIETLEYCHNKGIAHRDLKPENLLFDESFNLKIADFGFATLLAGKDDSGLLHTVLGTESYMAPEIHGKKPYSGSTVDLFASAIILFIMISGTPPFAKADPRSDPHYKLLVTPGKQEVFWKAHERNKPKKAGQETFYSAEFKDMINAMLSAEPSARPTLEQLKNHPWYNGPVLDSTTLREEFVRRKKLVDTELQQQREAKEKEKQRAKNAHHAQGAFTGVKPFRSLLTGEQGEKINKELEAKVNFEAKRSIQDYQPVTGFKAATEVFSVVNTEELFRNVCELSKINLADFTVSEDNYKIKGRIVTDEGTANMNILLTKVDENTTCVEFHKTNGNVMTFYNTIEKIKKGIPHVEVEEETTQEKTEAQ